MKKTLTCTFIIIAGFLLATLPTSTAASFYVNYMSIRAGESYTFTYTITPDDQSHQSPLSMEIPITITTIEDINDTACNVTYSASFKILVDGIPNDHVQVTTMTITNSTNATDYVFDAGTPWELFFINNVNMTNRTVDIPQAKNLTIGHGYIKWDDNGVLKIAYIHTIIKEMACLVTIVPKQPGSQAVPGFSVPVIIIMVAIPSILLGIKISKRMRCERIE